MSSHLEQSPFESSVGGSVGGALRRVLPFGPNIVQRTGRPQPIKTTAYGPWLKPPRWVPDLFAACGYLLESAGALACYSPVESQVSGTLRLSLSNKDHERVCEAARQFVRQDSTAAYESLIQDNWQDLIRYWSWPVNIRAYSARSMTPPWWEPALRLFILADEASDGVGFPSNVKEAYNGGTDSRLLPALILRRDSKLVKSANAAAANGGSSPVGQGVSMENMRPTLCQQADPDVVCVQPKGRIPDVGCSTRVFSRNLSLLRSRSTARCYWLSPPAIFNSEDGVIAHEDDGDVNVLLIPFPFEIADENFEQVGDGASGNGANRWKRFRIRQGWLNDGEAVCSMVIDLLRVALKSRPKIHGIVFPEYALNFQLFDEICRRAVGVHPDLEFVVAGSSDNCRHERGNWVLSRQFDNVGSKQGSFGLTSARGKHHRWRLNASQIQTYGLEQQFSPNLFWWEDLAVGIREVSIHRFRRSSTYAALICEDLARTDPCHELVRALGPHLIFVLLMDGPQLPHRWPARSAGGLAEDPGSSILTLTSKALIERNKAARRKIGKEASSAAEVGLWIDKSNANGASIVLEEDAEAILVSLKSDEVADVTLDGRPNQKARTWSLGEMEQLRR